MEKNEDKPLWYYIAISIALHLIVYLLFHFTLPHFKKELKEEVMTFEVVPVQDTSNIKTQKNQKQEEKREEKAKKREKSKKTEPKPAPTKKPTPNPKEDKKPAKKAAPKKLAQPQKKTPQKPKPKPKPKPKVNEMEQLLKNLEKESQGREERSKKNASEGKKNKIDDAIGKYIEKVPMSIAEENYFKHKMFENWNIPLGVRSIGEMSVFLHINLDKDGSVRNVEFVKASCPKGSEIACKAFIESTIRAVISAAPYDQLNPQRYEAWAEFEYNFTPPSDG